MPVKRLILFVLITAALLTAHGTSAQYEAEDWAVLTHLTPVATQRYRFGRSPQTTVLSNGIVLASWYGVLDEGDLAQAQRLLSDDARTQAMKEPT